MGNGTWLSTQIWNWLSTQMRTRPRVTTVRGERERALDQGRPGETRGDLETVVPGLEMARQMRTSLRMLDLT